MNLILVCPPVYFIADDRSERTRAVYDPKSYAKQSRQSGRREREGSCRSGFRDGGSVAITRKDEAGSRGEEVIEVST